MNADNSTKLDETLDRLGKVSQRLDGIDETCNGIDETCDELVTMSWRQQKSIDSLAKDISELKAAVSQLIETTKNSQQNFKRTATIERAEIKRAGIERAENKRSWW